MADAQECYVWNFSDLPPLETWSNKKGNIALIGDAAHAMLPYTNQGASQCIEDSACLKICLDRAHSPSDFPQVLRAFEQIRRPRVEWLTRKGRENAKMWHLHDGPEQQHRDQFLGMKPLGIAGKKMWAGESIDEPPEGQFNPLATAYIQGYDIVDYVGIHISHKVSVFSCWMLICTFCPQTLRRLDQILA
jgi:salicylate hydroxylase